jgi:hypothetical protein
MLIKAETTTNDYWNTFFILPESPEDVFNLCSHKDLRDILEKQPSNLTKLIQKVLYSLR